MIHYLKITQPYLGMMERGEKTFEMRKNDRNFKVGDVLLLYEFDPEKDDPAKAPAFYVHERGALTVYVTRVFEFPEEWGLKKGFCIMQVSKELPNADV